MKKQKALINDRFQEYFRENFFSEKPEELKNFLESLTKPLPKTIRVNTNRISVEDFKVRANQNNWTLTSTSNPTVFRIDRTDIKMPLGHTLEHLLGYFYIQELSASRSVHYLANGTIDTEKYLILDMAASPGGKTTQLAEHFPNSIIVANEPTRDRMAQLVSNTERLGNDHTMITNYDGGFYTDLKETFDRILIDAPCSGEGIGFKESQTVTYWNLKNIHIIARLQTKLLDAAFRALKTGGEVLYSTCTLNKIENEGVIHAIQARYPESFEVLFEKRFWPHEETSGGFFICKIRKNKEIIEDDSEKKIRSIKTNDELIPLTKNHERLLA
jgi:16S rRNA (cytosine1407-C5)-methyltransferase